MLTCRIRIQEGILMDAEKIISNIKMIECPVDELKENITSACKVPGMDGNPVVVIDRNEKMDTIGLQAYSVHIMNGEAPQIITMVREGSEGYVATVEEAFIRY
jgi:hypothetical protein